MAANRATKKLVNTVQPSKQALQNIGKTPGFEKVGTALRKGTTIKQYK